MKTAGAKNFLEPWNGCMTKMLDLDKKALQIMYFQGFLHFIFKKIIIKTYFCAK